MTMHFVDVAFPTAVRRLFTYSEPAGMRLRPGMRVLVPLRSEYVIGMVLRRHQTAPGIEVKEVAQAIDKEPLLGREMIALIDWVHHFYHCSAGEVIQTALPAGLNFVADKRLRIRDAAEPGLDGGLPPDLPHPERAKELLADIASHRSKMGMMRRDADRRWKGTPYEKVLRELIRRQILQVWEVPRLSVARSPELPAGGASKAPSHPDAGASLATAATPAADPAATQAADPAATHAATPAATQAATPPSVEPKTLNATQQAALERIIEPIDQRTFRSFLLFGVTGSGKTEVYIHALKRVLEQGRGGIVLVPEIALTPQTVRRFTDIFGDQVAVLHSRLTDRERANAWVELESGRKRIAIGPRSAVFAPVRDPGIIIVDEEHDASYKQFDPAPRYHARDVALVRARGVNAVVVMGSATPSLTTRHAANRGLHELLELPERPFGGMPEVHVLDLKAYRQAMQGPLAVPLADAIRDALDRGEQSILLYNRRGFASYLQCEACGHIPQSPACSVSLTYHQRRNILLCHYSGYSRRADTVCEACDSEAIVTRGMGTEQVEQEVAALFPGARIQRMDRDTTSGRTDHERIYDLVKDRQVDILIGTQMLAKGLDFPNVTVVGVLQAEQELAFPSWRSSERLFQLLSQVSGRAGRARSRGRVFIQTWKPEHIAIVSAKAHDVQRFESAELAERRSASYPPFSRIVQFHMKGASREHTIEVSRLVGDVLRERTSPEAVLGPSPAVIEWVQRKTHWLATLKVDPRVPAGRMSTMITGILDEVERRLPEGGTSVRITVDVDAVE